MQSELLIIAVYLIAMIGIGIWSNRFSHSLKSFMLGDRNAGAWMSAFGYGTTYFSAVVFIGYAGRNGWNFGLWVFLIGIANAILGTWLAWKALAKPTRRITHKLKLGTMPEFFNARYQSPKMRTFAAIIIFIFMTPYAASVFSGLSYLFESVFRIDYKWAMLLMAAVAGMYLTLGGYVAALIADFVQGCIMLVGVVLMIGVVYNNPSIGGFVDGTKAMLAQAAEIPMGDMSQPFNWLSLVSLILLTSFGTWGLPQMVHKFYAIKDDAAIKRGTVVSTCFAVIVSGGAYLTGAIAKLFYTNNMSLMPMNGEAIAFDRIIPDFLTSTLPSALLGIVIVLVLSASVTTLSSITLTSATSMTVDLVHAVKKDMSKLTALRLTRWLCLGFVAVSVVIAMTKSPIQMLMSFSWGTVSGCFIGPFLLGLYWRKTTRAGAWAGMVGGLCVSVVLAVASGFDTGSSPLFGAIAMALSMLLTWLVSLFTKQFDDAHIELIYGPEEQA